MNNWVVGWERVCCWFCRGVNKDIVCYSFGKEMVVDKYINDGEMRMWFMIDWDFVDSV